MSYSTRWSLGSCCCACWRRCALRSMAAARVEVAIDVSDLSNGQLLETEHQLTVACEWNAYTRRLLEPIAKAYRQARMRR